ncbi:RagB/SusD family nutrient uptake outer membrane protein [Hymenobacter terrenus]|uniref:RagB/SusD family nutrient uptake outer membrane protein n=1 Tax=Hymenobacter terrenus TaxID=1629124 RepID=UPI0006194C6B|nr:RagB/SusD family nutrient uptake outer membrane protein [Hymenobacter terrenus]
MKYSFTRSLATLGVAASLSLVSGCDLDRSPIYDPNTESVYSDPSSYKNVLAKLYGGLILSGQQGGSGIPDIVADDEGFTVYTRQLWNAQEITTDEATLTWGDAGAQEYNIIGWQPNNSFLGMMYNRIFFQVSACNEFLRQTTDGKLSDRGITNAQDLANIKTYRAEARFLRALSYWHAIDMFGNVPFTTENDLVGFIQPNQISRADLFKYIESELQAIEGDLIAPRQNEYARADKAAAWMLLAKLYLNAKVYTGQERNTDCLTYCNLILKPQTAQNRYTLSDEYRKNFLADNNTSPELIFPVVADGLASRSFGGTTYLVHAAVGGAMSPSVYGVDGGWGGLRARREFVLSFADTTGKTDRRAMFFQKGQSIDLNKLVNNFTDGIPVTKYKNITSAGADGKDPDKRFVDVDYPMFRLADVYLMYAEAVLRGGQGGDQATAIGYVNELRQRAYNGNSGNVSSIDLDFILAERGRELYWEGHRRTDLIRFDKFTSNAKLWQWKGATVQEVNDPTRTVIPMRSVADTYNLFPIPTKDIAVNPKLKQNPGY